MSTYETLKLTLTGGPDDSKKYNDFINGIRSLVPKNGYVHGIAQLHAESDLEYSLKYIPLELTGHRGTITLALSASDVSLVAFQGQNYTSYFFDNTLHSARWLVFANGEQREMESFDYRQLERCAGRERKQLILSMHSLLEAIDQLNDKMEDDEQQALSMLIFSQMISEAVRFTSIQRAISMNPQSESPTLNLRAIKIQDNWRRLSESVQTASEVGIFLDTVTCHDKVYKHVHQVVGFMALSAFCTQSETHDSHCPETAVQIVGLNGWCMDIKGNVYENGIPIIVYGFHGYKNQQWTFRADRTIRSKDKCLTASGIDRPGHYVMIRDYDLANPSTQEWTVNMITGEIWNPASNMYITVKDWEKDELIKLAEEIQCTLRKYNESISEDGPYSGIDVDILTLEPRNFTLGQGWKLLNGSSPTVTTILTSSNRCIQANGENLTLAECNYGPGQSWAIYADGSIRPANDEYLCMTWDENSKSRAVTLSPCERSKKGQRWEIKEDGTIMSAGTPYGIVIKNRGTQRIFMSGSDSLQPLAQWQVSW